mmetsp:Transcript_83915/g.153513  ORF Transcript_83915/g.153513 Transcript_83915/m.153513 type:complete len:105 (-) Transcript_83915:107-421(-)
MAWLVISWEIAHEHAGDRGRTSRELQEVQVGLLAGKHALEQKILNAASALELCANRRVANTCNEFFMPPLVCLFACGPNTSNGVCLSDEGLLCNFWVENRSRDS